MSEMSHVLAHTTRFNPLKRVARKLAPGNKRHVVLSNGVRISRSGPRFKQIPMPVAKENAKVLAEAIDRGVLEVMTPERKLMTSEEVLALATGKAPAKVEPKAEPKVEAPPPPPPPEEPSLEAEDEAEDDFKADEPTDPGRKTKKPSRKGRKGKE